MRTRHSTSELATTVQVASNVPRCFAITNIGSLHGNREALKGLMVQVGVPGSPDATAEANAVVAVQSADFWDSDNGFGR
jgi:hypothetical protein